MGTGTTAYSEVDKPANPDTGRVGEAQVSLCISVYPLVNMPVLLCRNIRRTTYCYFWMPHPEKEQGSCVVGRKEMLFQVIEILK